MAGLHICSSHGSDIQSRGWLQKVEAPAILKTPNLYLGNVVVKSRLQSPATRINMVAVTLTGIFLVCQDEYQNHISGSHDDSISWLDTMYYKLAFQK